MDALRPESLFDLQHSAIGSLLAAVQYPWEILSTLRSFLVTYGQTLSSEIYEQRGDGIWIARTAKIAPSASITGPVVIGPDTEVRHGAYIRGSALVGTGCVVGNSCELKNCVLFDEAKTPHFNYIGDSILGHGAHMGAGAVTSNVKSDKTNVVIRWKEPTPGELATGLRKLGAMLGDFAEVGCNSVLCPGSVVGRHSIVYPLSRVRGVLEAERIWKENGIIAVREMRG